MNLHIYRLCVQESWEAELFRDCNGESNGIELPEDTLLAEAAAEAGGEEVVFPDSEVEAAEAEEELDTLAAQQAQPLPILENIEQNYDEIPVNGLYQAPQ